MADDYSKREIDTMFDDISKTLARIEEGGKDVSARLTSLEKWRWVITGIVIGLGAINMPTLVAGVAKAFAGQ